MMQGKRDRDWFLQYKRGFPLIISGLGTWLGTWGAGHGLLFLGLGYGLVLISSYTRNVLPGRRRDVNGPSTHSRPSLQRILHK
jgi:hypothetical protein